MLWIYRQHIFILSFNFYLRSSIFRWFTYIYVYIICIIVIYTCGIHICIYVLYMRILYQSVKHILAVSLFIGLLFFVGNRFPVRWRTPRNNRVVRRGCKDLSVQFRKGLLGFSLICHILQSGAAVFTASSLRNNNKYQQIIHSDMKMYVSFVYQVFQCIKLI